MTARDAVSKRHVKRAFQNLSDGQMRRLVKGLARSNKSKPKQSAIEDALWVCLHANDAELDMLEEYLKGEGYSL